MDVQELLLTMRAEQREDHQLLVKKVDDGFSSMSTMQNEHLLEDANRFNAIDNRLKIVENTRRTIRWLTGVVIVAVVTGLVDAIAHHFHP